jgi:molybdenum cofactor biosynthesis enzyme MoaA
MIITEACNCGCKGYCRSEGKNANGPEEDLAHFKERERELREELEELRAKIKEIKGGDRLSFFEK